MENTNLTQKLSSYKVPAAAVDVITKTRVAFMVGVSGAGKDTVMEHLLASGKYHYIVSHTTRSPRSNHGIPEQDGVEYHFIDLTTAEQMLDEGKFIEAKMYSGNVYGTSVAEIQKAHDEGKIAISDIEVQGVAEYKAVAPNVIPIFLLPPDYATWQQRLAGRHEASHLAAEDMQKRMQTAKAELRDALDKDYFEFVINRDLEETVKIVDEVAHGNLSTKHNQEARKVAEELLRELEQI
jgi:guanylate kinase